MVKLAVQPLAKVIFSRTAIVGGGMAGGETIGSVVPGPSLITGCSNWRSTCYRDSFREHLLDAIRETRETLVITGLRS